MTESSPVGPRPLPELTPPEPRPLVETIGLKKHFAIRKGLWGKVSGYVRAVDGISLAIHPDRRCRWRERLRQDHSGASDPATPRRQRRPGIS